MSGMDETRDAVVDSCWLEGKDGKRKLRRPFCVTPLLSLSEPFPSPLTLYTCQRQYPPDYSFAPLSCLALSLHLVTHTLSRRGPASQRRCSKLLDYRIGK